MPRSRIESNGRFVEDQQFGPMQQSLCELDASRKSAGKRFNQVPGSIRNRKALHHLRHSGVELTATKSVELAVVTEIFQNSEFLVEAGILKDNADTLPDFVGLLLNIKAKDGCVPLSRRERSREYFEECGFTAAIRTKQSENFAPPHIKTDTIERASCRGLSACWIFVSQIRSLNGGRGAQGAVALSTIINTNNAGRYNTEIFNRRCA